MTDLQTLFHYDDANDKSIIEVRQDVEPIMDMNKRQMNQASSYHDGKEAMHHYARIPIAALEKYKMETGSDPMTDPEAMRRFLNDPDQRVWRVRGGKV